MTLLVVALFGLIVPNGLFLYWAATEFTGLHEVLGDKLALGFIIDAFMAVGLLAYYFAKRPIGPVKWPTFVILSLVGGLGFSLPIYWWLNTKNQLDRNP